MGSKSRLRDEVQSENRRQRPTTLDRLCAQMDDEDGRDLRAMLADESIKLTSIFRALRARGYDVTYNALRYQRRYR